MGEQIAARAYRRRGCEIIARNARTRYGELDLVARDGDVLIFCEVKTRRSHSAGAPADAIDARKQARLAQLAEAWRLQHPQLMTLDCRFDAALVARDGIHWRVEIIEDAFRPGW
ncbi:putative endonuclease [Magnetofaba australis IT-1]|uniref:UPF0102 protein MAIT1_00473 n=1 Tax=Magnetofaba australis IT-1 TaxID=1434232 RepID=A0A1Y2JYU5_9PROT|nr:putative endonuclease [Magnetofaba australis IT-1]